MVAQTAHWSTLLVTGGAVLLALSLGGWLAERFLFRDDVRDDWGGVPDAFTREERAAFAAKNQAIREAWETYPGGMGDGEPTDDEIYNGYGREGGIGYDVEPAYDEHDRRL